MRSLVLVGHGSHLNGESATAVYHYAELIRQRGLFDEVLEGFWKEEPSLRQILKTTASTDVTVIPLFISEGYFTETVIPRELGLGHQGPVPPSGIARVIGGRTVRYTLPYGVHPKMQEVILARAREALPDLNAADTALIVLGHGTTRNENSSRVTQHNAEAIRQSGQFAEVHALFLDQQPEVGGWPTLIRAARVVVVPFFASEGWHTQETIPADMNLTGPETLFAATPHGPQTVFYARPVGTHPLVAEVILQLAQEASLGSGSSSGGGSVGGGSVGGGDLDRTHHESWATFTRLAWNNLRLGEALITSRGDLFEMRHALDEGRPSGDLVTYVSPEGMRDQIRRDNGGQFRPVHTFRTLPRGWRVVVDQSELRRAVHYLYPAVVEETRAYTCHDLRFTPWPTTARRQTGLYAKVQRATNAQLEEVAAQVCSGCLRTRLWAGENLSQTFLDGVPGGIPCAEACTYLIAAVRDSLTSASDKSAPDKLTPDTPGAEVG